MTQDRKATRCPLPGQEKRFILYRVRIQKIAQDGGSLPRSKKNKYREKIESEKEKERERDWGWELSQRMGEAREKSSCM